MRQTWKQTKQATPRPWSPESNVDGVEQAAEPGHLVLAFVTVADSDQFTAPSETSTDRCPLAHTESEHRSARRGSESNGGFVLFARL
jgi:hypothetical protein